MLNLKDFEWLTFNSDNDRWFYNTGCQYPLVCPKGTKVRFVREYINYYGRWFEVEYEGKHYYAWPSLVDGNVIVRMKMLSYYVIASLTTKTICICIDRYGKEYRMINDEGDLELI